MLSSNAEVKHAYNVRQTATDSSQDCNNMAKSYLSDDSEGSECSTTTTADSKILLISFSLKEGFR